MTPELTKNIIEVALFAAGRPLSIDNLLALFDDKSARPDRGAIRAALEAIQQECTNKGLELKEVASGFRFQIKQEYAEWIGRLWAERPTRYSRALLETLALIAYRQPITRGEIEDIRGVGMSSSIMKTLLEREWVRVLGHREVPGRPAMYGTTRKFLDYFNLKSLAELPPLAEIPSEHAVQEDLFVEPVDAGASVGGERPAPSPEGMAESGEGVAEQTSLGPP